MKKLIATTAAVIAFGFPAMSQTADEICIAVGDLAESIMTARQNGTAMSDLMVALSGSGAAEEYVNLSRTMVRDAYAIPRMHVPENQRRKVQDFRAGIESECYSAIGQ